MINFTITGDAIVTDPAEPGGKKLVTYFVMRTAAYRNEILAVYPNTKSGSMAQDMATGKVYFLFGDEWLPLGGN